MNSTIGFLGIDLGEEQLEMLEEVGRKLDLDFMKTGVAVLACLVTILGTFWCSNKSGKYNFPPGPPGKFLVGSALYVADNYKGIHEVFTEWSKTYGNIFSLNMFGNKQLVICGRDEIREAAFKSADFSDRPYLYKLHYLLQFKEDITFANTSLEWESMKKTAFISLKTYSDGLQKVEHFSHELLTDLLHEFDSHKGQPFNPKWKIRDAINHFMAWLTYGEGFSKEELLQSQRTTQLVADVIGAKGIGGLLDLAPWLRFIPNQCVRDMEECINIQKSLFDARLRKGKAHYDPNDVTCALDVMIKQQPETKLTDDHLNGITKDLITAGTDTTSGTLHFFVALMANYPDIQKKAQSHIDKAIGDRLPLLTDKASLPYLEAMVWETLRLLTPAPLILRKATRDTIFKGYHIPKDTTLWVNFWTMHHDETYWDAPYEFRPERFLDAEGTVLPPDHPNRTQIMPFGAGRRVCVGETLARNRLFLFMTAFIQHFTFIPESPDKPPPADPRELEPGVINVPQDFNIRAISRN